jgi:F-type H+-transporting ATPase subunit alpha
MKIFGIKEEGKKLKEVGYISSIIQSIVYVNGLPGLKPGEVVITETGKLGITHALNKNLAEVLMIEKEGLRVGEEVTRTGEGLKIATGYGLLGRVIDPLSRTLDNLGPIYEEKEYRYIRNNPPPFIERAKINEQLESGLISVDFFVPIGYGQRELIIGDGKTGKTTFLLQLMTSQAKKGVICIYVGIGKKETAIKKVYEYLIKQNVMQNIVIVRAKPDDSSTLIYLAPFAGMSIAEYFRDKGEKVVVIFDDLTTHAKTYREISLLLKRNPGRDSYPGDIFYLHSSLLERAGNIKKGGKESSITALPVAETLENDLSGYIQTNLMAMTDGHIFFDINEFRKGKRPAINIFLSVSRVGNQTKTKIERELASWLRKKLLEYKNLLDIARFGVELSKKSQETIEFGKKLEFILNQNPENIISTNTQLLLLGLLITGFWQNKPLKIMEQEIGKIISFYKNKIIPEFDKEVVKQIENIEHLVFVTKQIIPQVNSILNRYGNA